MPTLSPLPVVHGATARKPLLSLRLDLTGTERSDLEDLLLVAQQATLETARLLEARNPNSPTVEELKCAASRAAVLRERIGRN